MPGVVLVVVAAVVVEELPWAKALRLDTPTLFFVDDAVDGVLLVLPGVDFFEAVDEEF